MSYELAAFESDASAFLPLSVFPPAFKLASAFVFSVCISLIYSHYIAFAAVCFSFTLAILGRLSLKIMLRRLMPVNLFFIFLWLFLPLKLSAGSFSFSYSGLALAGLITLKGNAVAAMLLVLLGTSTVSESCRGLLRLRLPEKLVTLLLLTHSNLSSMQKEYSKISAAAKLRGFVSGGSLAGYKTTAYLAAMLLVRSWKRSRRVSLAMRLRGFSGQYPLLELPPLVPYSKHGLIFSAGICCIAALMLLFDLLIRY